MTIPRALMWCAIVVLAAAFIPYGIHRFLLHLAVERRIEAVGAPVISSPWAVYLEKQAGTRNLLYHQRDCADIRQDRFVLHLYPEDTDRLAPARKRHGFSIHNFDFWDHLVSLGRNCLASVPLPDYPLSSVVTGQIRKREDGSPEFLWLYRFRPSGARVGSAGETAAGRFEGALDPDRYRTPLSAFAAGEWGAPVARSRFDLYFDGTALRYHKKPCTARDVKRQIFLYLHTQSETARSGEPMNRDFDFYDYGAVEDGECLALVPLPDGYAKFETGQSATPFWRVEGRLDRARYRAALRSVVAGEWETPIARSDFDLYLREDELRYYREPCAPEDLEARFFLELHRSRSDLERGASVNLDFDFYERGVIEDGKCLAIAPLPTEGYARLETGQYDETTSWRVEAVLDRTSHRMALASLDRGEWGEPEVRAGFDLYLADDEIRYVREPCESQDAEARFFLHLHFPPGNESGFAEGSTPENRDFDFVEYGVIEDDRCLALVPLPDASIHWIATGQFVSGERPIWRADLWPMRRLLESRLDAIAAGELGPPGVRSTFALYLDETALLLHRPACSASDLEEKFFLHLYPENEDDLPAARRGYGFENRDFSFLDQGFLFDEACLARVPLPDYPLARLRTGQFRPGGEPSWTAELSPGLRETTR